MIAIMGAMFQEVEKIESEMEISYRKEIADRIYTQGKLHGKEIVLVFSKCGKVSSALTATALIHEFKVTSLIFIGVAASIKAHVKVGDIVVGDRLFQYDMDCFPFFEKHEIPFTGKIYFDSDDRLKKISEISSLKAISEVKETFSDEIKEKLGIESPKVHLGDIASGDRFVRYSDCKEGFLMDKEKTLAVEMEGASVAQVCYEYKVPFTVVRSISDYANSSASVDFETFLLSVARFYSSAFVKHLLLALPNS